MSTTVSSAAEARSRSEANRRCTRRVRQELRDGLAVIAFSAAASTLVALTITVLVAIAG